VAQTVSVDWVTVVVGIVVAFVGGSALGSFVSWRAQRESDHYADVRHLRDLRAERVRAIFKPLLYLAQVRAEVIRQMKFGWQGETEEQRDARLNAEIERALVGYNEARVAMQLEPRIGQKVDDLFQTTFRAFNAYRIDMSVRKEMRAEGADRDQYPSITKLAEREKEVEEAVARLHAEMLRLLDDLETPLPPAPRHVWRRVPER
jgi:hypothetical protein